MISLEKIIKDVLTTLNKNRIKYLIHGGFAVSMYGYIRGTKDIDIWVEPKKENIKKLYDLFSKMNYVPTMHKTAEEFIKADGKHVIWLAYGFQVDVWVKSKEFTFEGLWKHRVKRSFGNIPCYYVSIDDLIKMKKETGRPKDLIDVKVLKKIKKKNIKIV